MFVGYSLHYPRGDTAFYIGGLYIGGLYIGSDVWRKFYLVYILIMGALFLVSLAKTRNKKAGANAPA